MTAHAQGIQTPAKAIALYALVHIIQNYTTVSSHRSRCTAVEQRCLCSTAERTVVCIKKKDGRSWAKVRRSIFQGWCSSQDGLQWVLQWLKSPVEYFTHAESCGNAYKEHCTYMYNNVFSSRFVDTHTTCFPSMFSQTPSQRCLRSSSGWKTSMTGLVWEKRWGLISVWCSIYAPTLVLGIDVGTMGHWGHVPPQLWRAATPSY